MAACLLKLTFGFRGGPCNEEYVFMRRQQNPKQSNEPPTSMLAQVLAESICSPNKKAIHSLSQIFNVQIFKVQMT